MDIVTQVLEFLRDNWDVIKQNHWTFVFFGILVSGVSVSAYKFVHKAAIKDVKERKALEQENEELRTKCEDLERQVFELDTNNRISEFKKKRTDGNVGIFTGRVMRAALDKYTEDKEQSSSKQE